MANTPRAWSAVVVVDELIAVDVARNKEMLGFEHGAVGHASLAPQIVVKRKKSLAGPRSTTKTGSPGSMRVRP